MLPRRFIANLKSRWMRFVLGWCAPELIQAICRALLDRMPTAAEASTYGAELSLHRDLVGILRSVLESGELRQKAFLSRVPESVKATYRVLLGREPDAEGERTYTAFLAEKRDLSALFSAISDSAESKRRQFNLRAPEFVNAAYEQLLRRAADPAELAAGVQSLAEERDLAPLLHRLAYSDKFQHKVHPSHVAALVRGAYQGLLGREADPEGERGYSAFLDRTDDIAGFSLALCDSAEFKQRLIASEYKDLECLQCNSLFGEEFFRHPVTSGLIRASYCFILGRRATQADVDLHFHDESAGALRKALLRSEEFRREMMNLFPRKLPAPGDIDAMKTIFLHIHKTGGTTMRDLLKPLFGYDRTCPEHFNGLHCYTAGDLARFRLFAGHFSLQSCDLIPGPKRLFTLLRHPVKLLVSFYNFARAHSEEIIARDEFWLAGLAHRQPDMRGFFSLEEVRRHPLMNNSMVRVLSKSLSVDPWEKGARIEAGSDAMAALPAAKENLRSFLTFGLLERYDESVELIFRALGLPAPPRIERKNVLDEVAGKVKGIERREREVCGPETLEVMAPLVEADLLLYQYGVELFEENIKTLKNR